jgi:isoleucyl-tRNA synthetase
LVFATFTSDKEAAYATLYEALVTISKLLTPTMPFLAEELYQNLVRTMNEESPLSVHLADWPEFDTAVINEHLNQEMCLVMRLASLGHAARNKANRKVRQPLAECAFSVGTLEERRIVEDHAELLADELNVKKISVLDTAAEAVAFSLNPLPKQLGQKYGNKFPAIRQAILSMNPEEVANLLLSGKPVQVTINSELLDILPEEVEVRAQARSGYAVANEGAYVAALVTELTPELVQEGLAREFIRRVQDLRKQAEFDITDRIRVIYQASPLLKESIEAFRGYIMTETLTVEMVYAPVPVGLTTVSDIFDGEETTIAISKVR